MEAQRSTGLKNPSRVDEIISSIWLAGTRPPGAPAVKAYVVEILSTYSDGFFIGPAGNHFSRVGHLKSPVDVWLRRKENYLIVNFINWLRLMQRNLRGKPRRKPRGITTTRLAAGRAVTRRLPGSPALTQRPPRPRRWGGTIPSGEPSLENPVDLWAGSGNNIKLW